MLLSSQEDEVWLGVEVDEVLRSDFPVISCSQEGKKGLNAQDMMVVGIEPMFRPQLVVVVAVRESRSRAEMAYVVNHVVPIQGVPPA